jgi:hypothetical protein
MKYGFCNALYAAEAARRLSSLLCDQTRRTSKREPTQSEIQRRNAVCGSLFLNNVTLCALGTCDQSECENKRSVHAYPSNLLEACF